VVLFGLCSHWPQNRNPKRQTTSATDFENTAEDGQATTCPHTHPTILDALDGGWGTGCGVPKQGVQAVPFQIAPASPHTEAQAANTGVGSTRRALMLRR